MEVAVIAIVALLAGAGLGWFLGSRPVAEWKARHGERDAEARGLKEFGLLGAAVEGVDEVPVVGGRRLGW